MTFALQIIDKLIAPLNAISLGDDERINSPLTVPVPEPEAARRLSISSMASANRARTLIDNPPKVIKKGFQ
jgi:hypothetical protein